MSLLLLGACETPIASAPLPYRDVYEQTRADRTAYEAKHGRSFWGGRVPLHYLMWGDDGPTLLWLHGTYSSAYEVAPFADEIVAAGYRVLSLDWYGHGPTPVPEEPVTLADLADDIAALLDSLDIEGVVLGAHSRGGNIAAACYEKWPERVGGLVLADGGSASAQAFFDGLGDEELGEFLDGWADRETGQHSAPRHDSEMELFLAEWERLGFPEDTPRRLKTLASCSQGEDERWGWHPERVLRWLGQDTYQGTWNGLRDVAAAPAFLRSCSEQDPSVVFEGLHVPMLILDATGDAIDLTVDNLELARRFPGLVTYRAYPCGHDVLRGMPDEFRADTLAFLQRITRR